MGSEHAARVPTGTAATAPRLGVAARPVARRSLVVGSPDDAVERIADEVAAIVARRPPAGGADVDRPGAPVVVSRIRRASSPPTPAVVGAADAAGPRGGPLDDSTATRIRSSTGRPMAPAVQREMGSAFGVDFGRVRVHTGAHADQLTTDLGARAFTIGSDVFFREGEYQPQSRSGRQVLAHELTHTIQQGAGAVQRVRRADYRRDDVVGQPELAPVSVSVVSPHASALVVRRLRWHGQAGVSNRTVDEVYESLKGRLQKGWNEVDVRRALTDIEKEQDGRPDGEMPDWQGVQNLLKIKMGTQTQDQKEAARVETRRLFSDCVNAAASKTPFIPPTIKLLKDFLDTGEVEGDFVNKKVWRTGLRVAEKTYQAPKPTALQPPPSVKAKQAQLAKDKTAEIQALKRQNLKLPEQDPRFILENHLSPEELSEWRQYTAEVKAQGKPKVWKDTDPVPVDVFEQIARGEADKQVKAEALQKRGIPPEVFKDTNPQGGPSALEKKTLEALTHTLQKLDAATSDDVYRALVNEVAPTAILRYLRDLMVMELIEIGRYADSLKPAAKKEIHALVLKWYGDVALAKGACGELQGVLFAAQQGTEVNTGGENKLLPSGKPIGNEDDQDIDIRYLKAGDTRVHIEAKWDAATLIKKYKGHESPTNSAEREKSYQQQRYEAVRDKSPSSKAQQRELVALVSNPHDWLRFFTPGAGVRVARWLAEAGWTLVIKDKAISPDRMLELLNVVPKCFDADGGGDGERWADRTSPRFPDPLEFLKVAADVSEYLKVANTADTGSSPKDTSAEDKGARQPGPIPVASIQTAQGALHLNTTAGAGNCFFHSLYETLTNTRSGQGEQQAQRQAVIEAYHRAPILAQTNFGGFDTDEWNEFTTTILTEGNWAADHTPSLVADALALEIVIHNPDGSVYYRAQPNGALVPVVQSTVHVYYDGGHYNSYTANRL